MGFLFTPFSHNKGRLNSDCPSEVLALNITIIGNRKKTNNIVQRLSEFSHIFKIIFRFNEEDQQNFLEPLSLVKVVRSQNGAWFKLSSSVLAWVLAVSELVAVNTRILNFSIKHQLDLAS